MQVLYPRHTWDSGGSGGGIMKISRSIFLCRLDTCAGKKSMKIHSVRIVKVGRSTEVYLHCAPDAFQHHLS